MKPDLTFFIGISLVAHLVVAIGFIGLNNTVRINEQGRSSIDVEIYQEQNTNHKVKSRTFSNSQAPSVEKPKTRSAKKNDDPKPQIVPIKSTAVAISQPGKPAAPHYQPEIIQDSHINHDAIDQKHQTSPDIGQIESIIKTELSKFFYYPKSAQRKNWQGLVIISFFIRPNGVISNIKVNKSSGYSVLDSAAVDALSKVQKEKELALALNGNSFSQLLPVTYQLTN